MIETSRSEGQQMVFDLGELVAHRSEPTVVKDRDVRNWIGRTRKLFETDPKLESAMTIRKELKHAGLVEVVHGATEGRRWVAFANQAALNLVPMSPAPTWDQLKGYLENPDDLVKPMM